MVRWPHVPMHFERVVELHNVVQSVSAHGERDDNRFGMRLFRRALHHVDMTHIRNFLTRICGVFSNKELFQKLSEVLLSKNNA